MSTLLVVRHGQASFGAENYDVLSSLGIKQSRRLGTWMARRAIRLDALWCGPLQRQIDTARHLVDAAADEGLRLPEPEILDDFRELPASQLVQHVLPQLNKQPRSQPVQASQGQWAPLAEYAPSSALELVLDAWAKGLVDVGALESFAAFEARIQRALEHVINRAVPDQCIAVVTSAGPLAVAMRLALNLDHALTMKLGSVTANGGVTELRFSRRRIKLVTFNSVGHLEPEEVTHI